MNIEPENAWGARFGGIAGIYIVLAGMVFFFAFYKLGGRMLWEDEAETATLARNVLKFGIPKVNDGSNDISLHGDKFDARNGIWTWSPWLQEYIAAASFDIFGTNTWAARAPFALIGWLAVVLIGAVVWKIYRSHRIALASMLLLGTSEIFLLHIRQCRYYSITVLAEILLIYGIYQALQKNKNSVWLISSALIIQFYCNYTISAANVPVLLMLGWMLFREERCSAWPIVISLAVWALACAPWLLYSKIGRNFSADQYVPLAYSVKVYCVDFNFHFFPWLILLLPLWGWLYGRLRKNAGATAIKNPTARFETCLLLLPVLYMPVLLVMPAPFSRYLLPVLPVMCLLVAVWLFRYIRWTIVAIAILMVQCLSNVFAVASSPFWHYPLCSPIADFVSGFGQPYDDRFADVLKFLKAQAQPGDVVLSWNTEFPLIFYGPYKVINARLPLPATSALPDWILPKSISSVPDLPPVPLPDLLKPHYQRFILTVRASSRFADIPQPDSYQYKSTDASEPFVLYRLKKNIGTAPEAPRL